MSRSKEAVLALREELQRVVAFKEELEVKIDNIRRQLEIIESVTNNPVTNTKDLLKFKD